MVQYIRVAFDALRLASKLKPAAACLAATLIVICLGVPVAIALGTLTISAVCAVVLVPVKLIELVVAGLTASPKAIASAIHNPNATAKAILKSDFVRDVAIWSGGVLALIALIILLEPRDTRDYSAHSAAPPVANTARQELTPAAPALPKVKYTPEEFARKFGAGYPSPR